ncbi:MAG: hypothetical protein H6662_17435 [Ardenticatenaceae bacterium]|nr:hypothetical protein [Anaerolineales bacterium]MCB8923372.1 hypothetical protein [Ardenticatenaceae bacterium]
MPQYLAPQSDVTRLAFMSRAIKTAEAVPEGGIQRLPAQLLADLKIHYAAYRAAYDAAEAALSQRKTETAESAAAMARLQMYLSHLWTAVTNRAQRENQPVGVLGYYKLTNDGARPTPRSREEWLEMAQSVINGDAAAAAAGHPAAVSPSAAEVQDILDIAIAESNDLPVADTAYDEAQTAVAALRPQADKLIKAVRAAVIYSTYDMDPASQRRVLRNFGSVYRHLPGETVEDEVETAVASEDE